MPKDKTLFGYFAIFALIAGLTWMIACSSDSDDEDIPNFTGMEGRWDFAATFMQDTTSTSAAGEAIAEASSTSPYYYTGYFSFDANGAVDSGYVYLNGSSTAMTITEGKTLINEDGVTYSLRLTLSSGDVLTIERWAPSQTLRYFAGRVSSTLYGYGMFDGFRYDSSVTFGTSSEFAGDWRYYLSNASGTVSGEFSVGYDGTISSGSYTDSSAGSGTFTGSLSSDTSANVSSTWTYASSSSTISFLSVKLNSSKNGLGGIAQASTIGTGRLIAYRIPLDTFSSSNVPGSWLLTILDQNSSLWYVGIMTIDSNLSLSVTLWKSSANGEYTFTGDATISSTGAFSVSMSASSGEDITLGGAMNSAMDAVQGFGSSDLEGSNLFVMVKLPTTTATAPSADTTGTTSSFYTYSSYSSYSYAWQVIPMNMNKNEAKVRALASKMLKDINA